MQGLRQSFPARLQDEELRKDQQPRYLKVLWKVQRHALRYDYQLWGVLARGRVEQVLSISWKSRPLLGFGKLPYCRPCRQHPSEDCLQKGRKTCNRQSAADFSWLHSKRKVEWDMWWCDDQTGKKNEPKSWRFCFKANNQFQTRQQKKIVLI